jgi:hypothetical protein
VPRKTVCFLQQIKRLESLPKAMLDSSSILLHESNTVYSMRVLFDRRLPITALEDDGPTSYRDIINDFDYEYYNPG